MRKESWNLSRDSDSFKHFHNYGTFTPEEIKDLYGSIAHMLSSDQQEYLDRLMNGEAEPDPMLDLAIFMRLVHAYGVQAVKWSVEERKVTKDIGSILGEVRQGAVALENMKNKREELDKAKNTDDDGEGLDRASRESAFSILEGFLGGDSER